MNATAQAKRYHQVLTCTSARVTVQCFNMREDAVECEVTMTAVGAKPVLSLGAVSVDETYAALRNHPEYANRSWEFVLPDGTVQAKA